MLLQSISTNEKKTFANNFHSNGSNMQEIIFFFSIKSEWISFKKKTTQWTTDDFILIIKKKNLRHHVTSRMEL